MKNKQTSVKIVDVAKRADCSPATVSRVLNGNQAVAEEIRDRVVKAANDLGYVPNGAAKALSSTKSRLVGAIIPTLDHAIYATMIDALQARLADRATSVVLSTSLYDADVELKQLRLLIERGVEAVVLVGASHRSEAIKLLDRHNIPYVLTYTNKLGPRGAAVGFDNVEAGTIAARFLYDLGHRRFGMLAGITRNNDRATDRVTGFKQALQDAGVAEDAITVIEAPYQVQSGQEGAKALLKSDPRITAIFCGSDILAAGALKHCAASRIRVPEDISVLGFDNLEIAGLTTPELSTLEVPAKEMGRLSAEYIMAEASQQVHIRRPQISVRLVIRGSTGPGKLVD
ncbi:LacI family DNA-binding transcriptional regulator [Uliginosibacterium sp. sgz301328]|uniref:LacI family DNA-binding transcriptional regulator n=1 Tax=Uliginosibacterium sp. sgz301328 TaxID=3243764 RepID=UPI00359E7C20